MLRTTYNDKGEEVTEMVYEDEPAPEPAQPAVQPQARLIFILLMCQDVKKDQFSTLRITWMCRVMINQINEIFSMVLRC